MIHASFLLPVAETDNSSSPPPVAPKTSLLVICYLNGLTKAGLSLRLILGEESQQQLPLEGYPQSAYTAAPHVISNSWQSHPVPPPVYIVTEERITRARSV